MIKLSNVSFIHSGSKKKILSDINIEINKNEVILVAGSNGSGKTTMAKLISGIIKPTTGSYYFNDELITKDNYKVLINNIAFVFQNPSNSFITSNVEDELAIGLEFNNVEPTKIAETIKSTAKELGISDLLDREISSLSGGEMQKVSFASQYVLGKSIFILDEPFSMLDNESKIEFRNFLIKNKKNITIIILTHDILFSLMCHKMVVMKDGGISSIDDPYNIVYNKKILLESNLKIPNSFKMFIDREGAKKTKDIFNSKDFLKMESIVEKWK